jgi:peptidyl-prolyl cis-trans isomerase D
MFDFVAKHRRLLQIILGLAIVPPFAFWGIQWTQRERGPGAGDVASVGGQKISEPEFNDALRQQQDRMRALLGRNFNPAVFDSVPMRAELLEGMISQRLLMDYAIRSNLTVGNDQVSEVITSIPAFQEDGKYSRARAEAMMRAEGYSPDAFVSSLRRDLMMQQVTGALADSGIASKATAGQLARLSAQQREVAEHLIDGGALLKEVAPTPEAVRAYYDGNLAQFQAPEQIAIEYIVLDPDAAAALEPVSVDDVKKAYAQGLQAGRFSEPEQRQASHILLAFKPNASDQDKAQVRKKAEAVLAQVRKSPGSFAEVARKVSEDPGSASKGGDLGYFSRGMMVGSFENAAFQLKLNQISDLVESEFGYHIIKLTGIKPGKTKSLDEVRQQLERELRNQRASKRYAEAAESFANIVYEQPDSLKPAAEKFKLPVRRAEGITRRGGPAPLLNQPKMLAALFTDDVIRNHRNTETVEVAPATLVAARVVEHKPAFQRQFETVKGEITRLLAQEQALALARQRGAEQLEKLKRGDPLAVTFGPTKVISRDKAQGLREDAVARIFSADASRLPTYAGVDTPGGFALYRITRVIDAAPDEARQRAVQTELGRASGAQEFRAFLGGLRSTAKVEINKDVLEKKSTEGR